VQGRNPQNLTVLWWPSRQAWWARKLGAIVRIEGFFRIDGGSATDQYPGTLRTSPSRKTSVLKPDKLSRHKRTERNGAIAEPQ
jgi:hypothetical protein